MEDKHQKVEEANRRLAELTNQLHHTEMRVANAAEHLVKLTDLVEHSRTSLPDPDRENLERDLDALQQTVGVVNCILCLSDWLVEPVQGFSFMLLELSAFSNFCSGILQSKL